MVLDSGKILTKDNLYVLLMTVILFAVYWHGAHSYPWLEDSDSYEHASAVRFISEFGHPFQPEPYAIHYLLPYPPIYDILATVFYRLSALPIPDALKTFNALLCALTIPTFYLWSKAKFGERIGIWSTFAIFALPSFMSHFIWSQSLAILLMFPAMYLLEKRSKWSAPAMALVLITQPSVAVIFTLIMCIYAWFMCENKKFSLFYDLSKYWKEAYEELKPFYYVVGAVALAFVVFWLPIFLMYGTDAVLKQITFTDIYTFPSQTYGLTDFINAPLETQIDQATGFGWPIFFLAVFGLGMALRNKDWFLVSLFVFCLIGTEGNLLPYKLFPHRFWVFLAIPVAILSANAIVWILEKSKILLLFVCLALPQLTYVMNKVNVVATILVLLILLFCFAPKFEVQTMAWPSHQLLTLKQMQGWMALQANLPRDTMVFGYCNKEQLADGSGLRGRAWDEEVIGHKRLDFTNDQDYLFLRAKGYQYAVIDVSCILDNTPETTNGKIQQLLADERFQVIPELSNEEMVVIQVVSPSSRTVP